MTIPAQDDLTNVATNAAMQVLMEAQRDFISSLPGGGPRDGLEISAGTITPGVRDHGGVFKVDTQASASTDDLDTIINTNIDDGQFIILRAENASRVVTLKDADGGTGEMLMLDSVDFVLDTLDKWIRFQRVGTTFEEQDRSRIILANECHFEANRATAQTGIASSTWTKVKYISSVLDYGGNFDEVTNYHFTAPAPGVYMFNATAAFDNLPDTRDGRIRLSCSTAGLFTGTTFSAGSLTDARMHVSLGVVLVAGETVHVDILHTHSSALATLAQVHSQWFTGTRLS